MTTMMTTTEEWKISKHGRACSLCARQFRSEEDHYSGIAEIEGRFERRDLCLPCWEKKPDLFSFWKTRMAKREQKRLEDIAAMVEFFKKLIEKPSEDAARNKIIYLTALLLARKRRLRLGGSKDGKIRIEKSWDGETIEIVDPPITDAELNDLKTQMEHLFEIELGGCNVDAPPEGKE
jgi:hypothetical protein